MNQFAPMTFSDAFETNDGETYVWNQEPPVDKEREENLELIGILLTEEFEDAFQEDVFAVVA